MFHSTRLLNGTFHLSPHENTLLLLPLQNMSRSALSDIKLEATAESFISDKAWTTSEFIGEVIYMIVI